MPILPGIMPILNFAQVARMAELGLLQGSLASRSRNSQIGSHASDQSRPLPSRETFQQRVAEMQARFAEGDVRPMGRDASGVQGMKLRSGDAVGGGGAIPGADLGVGRQRAEQGDELSGCHCILMLLWP